MPVCSGSGQILSCLPTTSDNRRLCRCKVLPKAKPLAHSRAAASKQLCCPYRFYFLYCFCFGVSHSAEYYQRQSLWRTLVRQHQNSFAASIAFIFYIVFVVGVSHSAECDQGRCPLETHELFVKSSIKNFIMFCVSGLRFRSPERVSAGRFPRPESALHCTDPANWFCR